MAERVSTEVKTLSKQRVEIIISILAHFMSTHVINLLKVASDPPLHIPVDKLDDFMIFLCLRFVVILPHSIARTHLV
jgi:hypothetical protein